MDPQANWTVPARVIANGGGAEFMITLFQPPSFTAPFFDEQMKLIDIELTKLKELLEKAGWALAAWRRASECQVPGEIARSGSTSD